jgi:cell division protein FtsB
MLKPVAILAVLAGLIAYAIIMLRGPQGVKALEDKQQQIRALEEENANLRRDIESKKSYIERLKTDTGTIAVEIEKRLGKVRPGVTEFREPGQHSAPTSTDSEASSTEQQR